MEPSSNVKIMQLSTWTIFLLSIFVIDTGLCVGKTDRTSDPTSFREPDTHMNDESSFDITNFPLGIPDPVSYFWLVSESIDRIYLDGFVRLTYLFVDREKRTHFVVFPWIWAWIVI